MSVAEIKLPPAVEAAIRQTEAALREIDRVAKQALRLVTAAPAPPPADETVGERVKRLRLEKGLSQRDLQGKGVSYAYISRIEAGARTPSVKAIRVLAENLGVTPEYLETGDEMLAVHLEKNTVLSLIWAVKAAENDVPAYMLAVASACQEVVEVEEVESFVRGSEAEPL